MSTNTWATWRTIDHNAQPLTVLPVPERGGKEQLVQNYWRETNLDQEAMSVEAQDNLTGKQHQVNHLLRGVGGIARGCQQQRRKKSKEPTLV